MLVIVFGLGFVTAQTPSQPKNWPNKPIKLIVGFPPGGGIDMVARLLQTPLQENLGQQVIIEYKPGAGGVLAASELMRSPPDGYTILLANIGPFVLAPNMMTKRPYDASRDFTWISQTSGSGFIAAVSVNHPANNLNEFITWAKANSDKANFASGGSGSITHLNGELLNQSAGLKMVHVPYKGSGPAITDLIGGQLDGMFESLVTATNYVKGGKLRLLSVSGESRNKNFPEVPALNEVVPGVVGGAWFGISAPAKLPMPIANRLQTEIQAIVNAPDMLSRLTEMGMTPMPLTGQDFVNFLQAENRRWGPVIRSGKITVE